MTIRRLAHWWRRSYPDHRLAWHARQAVASDPLLLDLTRMSITCDRGVIRLTGRVPHASDRTRIEGDIHHALRTTGLPYRRIVNQLYAP